MLHESELLTQFHNICRDAEVLALKSLHDIELPLCGYLTVLTSSDCLKLIKSELNDWTNLSQPSMERILFNYIITDYINCGLSSPTFYTVFQTTLQSKKSKIKLLKDLTTVWDDLFKNYEISSINVDFLRHFVVSLERLFLKISNFHSCIKFQCIKVISRLKYNIKMYDQSILDSQILNTLSDNNIKQHNFNKRKYFDVKNIIQSNLKENPSVPTLCLQNNQNLPNMNNSTTLNTENNGSLDLLHSYQIYTSGTFIDQDLPKNSTLLSNDAGNSSTKVTKSDSTMIQSRPKLNAFQIMMSNAKKHKQIAK